MTRCIVLGRFQPFHLGHARLVEAAVNHADGDEVVVAIGSAQAGWEANNPWTAEERQAMVEAWANSTGTNVTVVCIEDINDPPIGLNTLQQPTVMDGWSPRTAQLQNCTGQPDGRFTTWLSRSVKRSKGGECGKACACSQR
jgi:cytidyltransferase-like protein